MDFYIEDEDRTFDCGPFILFEALMWLQNNPDFTVTRAYFVAGDFEDGNYMIIVKKG